MYNLSVGFRRMYPLNTVCEQHRSHAFEQKYFPEGMCRLYGMCWPSLHVLGDWRVMSRPNVWTSKGPARVGVSCLGVPAEAVCEQHRSRRVSE
jgi:hypothetical protein